MMQCFVSIHAPAWGATDDQAASVAEVAEFQSTHPRGVRRSNLSSPDTPMLFQSTHPRGVRHMHPKKRGRYGPVSIHAPAWGATGAGNIIINNDEVFQSTHPRGVRHALPQTFGICMMFQSTHPRGVRRPDLYGPPGGDAVSIHAPAWGATGLPCQKPVAAACFNPRTRVGCDAGLGNPHRLLGWFQSTHPRGVRRCQVSLSTVPGLFQSTHPRGVRPDLIEVVPNIEGVSIHAPAWGATRQGTLRHRMQGHVSIHAPAWGATTPLLSRLQGLGRFQSTHPRGVRLHSLAPRAVGFLVSIHAPAWGATQVACAGILRRAGFNPRTRVGCDDGHAEWARPCCRSFNPRTRVGCDLS